MLAKTLKRALLPCLVVLIAFGIYQYFRPIPEVVPTLQIVSVPKTQAISLPWPKGGQAAVGAVGYGVLESHNASKPVPIASIAKVITALAVLKQQPIAEGSQGPTITLDGTDVSLFDYYYLRDGSVAKVKSGGQLSEYQALQAMLIPSANNIADSLARWAFGSVDAYVLYANQMVKDMGLTNTKVGDASGFADTTTSTAEDLVKLGIAALNNPSVAKIVSQSSAKIPVAGEVNNVNFLLGQDGYIGIKTGNTDKAGGCFLFAAEHNIFGRKIKLVGAILGQPTRNDAIKLSQPLLKTSDSGFVNVTVLHKNQNLAYYRAPWDETASAVVSNDVSLLVWKGKDIKISNEPQVIKVSAESGANNGNVIVRSAGQTASSNLVLSNDLEPPSFWWRLLR